MGSARLAPKAKIGIKVHQAATLAAQGTAFITTTQAQARASRQDVDDLDSSEIMYLKPMFISFALADVRIISQ